MRSAAGHGTFLHNEAQKQNVGFADGHSKWLARDTIVNGFDYRGLIQ